MLARAWQSMMIALARSIFATRHAQSSAWGKALARRFVAGAGVGEALARADALMRWRSIRSSLFYLGDYVSDAAAIAATTATQLELIKTLGATTLDLHVSVDPTEIGQTIDEDLARRNAFTLGEAIAAAPDLNSRAKALMLDMEDPAFADATIALHDALKGAGLPAALTLQAYLRRTEADLDRQIASGSHVRLVKGAFLANAAISYTRHVEIKANLRRLIDRLLSRQARESGVYASIATHDFELQNHAIALAAANGWQDDEWEFEMLLGVRDDLAALLAASGRRVRLYVPFGRNWFPYAMRRMGESPGNAWLLARSLLMPG